MNLDDRIEINPHKMMGKPVIRGTRLTVELILNKLGDGAAESEVLEAYPTLTREDILAAMRFGAQAVAHEAVIDLEVSGHFGACL